MKPATIRPRLAALAVAGLLSGGAQAEEAWVEDPISGCAIWVSDADVATAISWTGDCADGKASGPGVLTVFDDGRVDARFRGRMEGGKALGYGLVHYWDETGYAVYEGELAGSRLHGEGTLTLADGSRYTGDFEGDKPHGTGMFVDAAGNRYQGEFRDGVPHGQGSDSTASGEDYTGEYADGKRHGKGTLLYADGNSYEGDFVAGSPEGIGRFDASEGVYEGPVAGGEPAGMGRFTAVNGDVYEGPFEDGEPNGTFRVIRLNGTEESQVWKMGELVR